MKPVGVEGVLRDPLQPPPPPAVAPDAAVAVANQ